jgi:transposase
MPSFPVVSIELSEAEREQLESWSRRWTTAQALAQRSRIVLLASEGLRTGEVAKRLGVHRNTVAKWRRRFEAERLDGLVDEPRPGQPRTITDATVDEVITKTLEAASRDATQWSTRRWRPRSGSRSRRCTESGKRSGCSRTAQRPSS